MHAHSDSCVPLNCAWRLFVVVTANRQCTAQVSVAWVLMSMSTIYPGHATGLTDSKACRLQASVQPQCMGSKCANIRYSKTNCHMPRATAHGTADTTLPKSYLSTANKAASLSRRQGAHPHTNGLPTSFLLQTGGLQSRHCNPAPFTHSSFRSQFRAQTAPSCQESTASGSAGWAPSASAFPTALPAAAASRPRSCCPC